MWSLHGRLQAQHFSLPPHANCSPVRSRQRPPYAHRGEPQERRLLSRRVTSFTAVVRLQTRQRTVRPFAGGWRPPWCVCILARGYTSHAKQIHQSVARWKFDREFDRGRATVGQQVVTTGTIQPSLQSFLCYQSIAGAVAMFGMTPAPLGSKWGLRTKTIWVGSICSALGVTGAATKSDRDAHQRVEKTPHAASEHSCDDCRPP